MVDCTCSCKCLASPTVTNVTYVFIIMICVIVSLAVRYAGLDLYFGPGYAGPVCFSIDNPSICPGMSFSRTLCESQTCAGYWAVFRMSFTLSSFFCCMLLLTACKSAFSTVVHSGFWLVKFVAVGSIFAATLFMPNDVFAYFAWIARFVAPLFLLYQIIVFIDFGYTMSEKCVQRDEDQSQLLCLPNSGNKYKGIMLVCSIVLILGSIAASGVMFSYFPVAGCAINGVLNSTNLVLVLLHTAIAISPIAEHGSILTSSVVGAYTTWLCFSSLQSSPFAQCNPSLSQDHVGSLVVSVIIAGLSIGYLSFKIANRLGRGGKAPESSLGADSVTVAVGAEEVEVEPRSYANYYLAMFTVSMYIAMLLTNWGSSPEGTLSQKYNIGLASSWLQAAACWTCSILYLWTLIAPRLFPNRDFS